MMDIEDAHKLKILTTQETKELYSHFFTEERLERIHKICQLVTDTNEQIAYLRSSAIGVLTKACVETFVTHEEELLSGTFQGPLIKQIAQPVRDAYKNVRKRQPTKSIAPKMYWTSNWQVFKSSPRWST